MRAGKLEDGKTLFQYTLCNLVVAVLMKHLEESNDRNKDAEVQALNKPELSLLEEEEAEEAAAEAYNNQNPLAKIEREFKL